MSVTTTRNGEDGRGGEQAQENRHGKQPTTMSGAKMFVSRPPSLELSGSDQASAAEPSSVAPPTSRNHPNDPLATNDPSTELALLMYRAKIDEGNENEDVDALFAANLVQETNRLAQDMNGLSAEEREQAYFDLHGIPSNSSSSNTTTRLPPHPRLPIQMASLVVVLEVATKLVAHNELHRTG
jgi:hypothetical protein